MNKLNEVLSLIEEARIEKKTKLQFYNIADYSEPDLLEIPEALFELTDLEELEISSMFSLNIISDNFSKLINLKKLEIKGNFTKFPLELMRISSLTDLSLECDTFSVLPKDLNKWNNLTYLNLGSCEKVTKVSGLPPNLRYIYINGSGFKAFPKKIFELKQLTKIVMRRFKLKELPQELFNLENLISLFVGDNLLTSLPVEILQLKRLRELWLDDNQFESFPEIITEILSLERLCLRRNYLNDIPNRIINLKNLEELDLGTNLFTSIPIQIFEMVNLKEISFGNLLFGGDREVGNKITIIPTNLLNLNNLTSLDISYNSIENVPSEIIKEGVNAIKNFLRSIIEADKEEFLYEAKMVVVGRGDVGKTVLTKKLTHPDYSLTKSITTKGINILKNPFEFEMNDLKDNANFRFNIWDFGGQEKYDATHQLFITNRSIYLFLTEARAESNYHDVFYWLNTISLFSYNSPVIIVLSKYDERKKVLPESTYKEKFENIVQFVDVSCADGYEFTIENLKSAIRDAIKMLPQTRLTLSNHWVDIRNELEKLSQNQDYIEYEEYLKICERNKLDKSRADFLSEYLNDLGVIIHHKQDLLLKKTVFINTDWCVDGMYKVLDDDKVFQNKGKFSNEDLSTIWNEKRFETKQAELIRLMRDYSLCFELADQTGYIAPDLLSPDKPSTLQWDFDSNLQFEYQYTFMPSGMVSRFIVKSHAFIKDDIYWKYGVVLKFENTEALIEEDYINSKIKISLKGDNKKGLLSAIKMFIDEVHKDFDKANKLVFIEMVPCNCSECIISRNPHFFKFNVLKRFEEKVIREINCEISLEAVTIKNLINDVQIQSLGDYFDTSEDLKDFILRLLKDVLEHEVNFKGGYINFWRDKDCTEPKNEIEIQPYICNVIDTYCKVRGINLSREVKEANGNVDVLFSFTNRDNDILKVCLEIKKAHHLDVESAIITQLPLYMKSVGTESGIYLVIWYKHSEFSLPEKFKSSKDLETVIRQNEIKGISSKIINCGKPVSPSKVKK